MNFITASQKPNLCALKQPVTESSLSLKKIKFSFLIQINKCSIQTITKLSLNTEVIRPFLIN